MCWLCAHAVVDHDATVEVAYAIVARCTCPARGIYPADVLAEKEKARGEPFPTEPRAPRSDERVDVVEIAPRSKAVSARDRSRLARAAAAQTHKYKAS